MEAVQSIHPRGSWFSFTLRAPLFVLLLFKVLLRKTLLGLVVGLQTASRHKLSTALVGLLLVALIWANLRLQSSATAGGALSALSAGQGSVAPAPIIESYLKAQNRFDAGVMWETMSERYQKILATRGVNAEILQQQLDMARSHGRHFKDITYVAGYELNDGSSIYLYVVTVEMDGESQQVPHLFTVDPNGKIDNIE